MRPSLSFLLYNELYEPIRHKARQDRDMIKCFFGKHSKLEWSLRLKVQKALKQQETQFNCGRLRSEVLKEKHNFERWREEGDMVFRCVWRGKGEKFKSGKNQKYQRTLWRNCSKWNWGINFIRKTLNTWDEELGLGSPLEAVKRGQRLYQFAFAV